MGWTRKARGDLLALAGFALAAFVFYWPALVGGQVLLPLDNLWTTLPWVEAYSWDTHPIYDEFKQRGIADGRLWPVEVIPEPEIDRDALVASLHSDAYAVRHRVIMRVAGFPTELDGRVFRVRARVDHDVRAA